MKVLDLQVNVCLVTLLWSFLFHLLVVDDPYGTGLVHLLSSYHDDDVTLWFIWRSIVCYCVEHPLLIRVFMARSQTRRRMLWFTTGWKI